MELYIDLQKYVTWIYIIHFFVFSYLIFALRNSTCHGLDNIEIALFYYSWV